MYNKALPPQLPMPFIIFYICNRHNKFTIITTIMQGKINRIIWFLQLPLSFLISKSIYTQPGEKLIVMRLDMDKGYRYKAMVLKILFLYQ